MAGTKAGFLTEPRREYLRTDSSERDAKYSESQKNQFEDAIAQQANMAVGDLILIARGCAHESLKPAFPPAEIADLIDAILDRIGMDEVAGRERYYEYILKAIEHRIHEKYREEGRFFKLESSDYPVMPARPAYKDIRAYTRK
jgi:phytoene/squalene synthetase